MSRAANQKAMREYIAEHPVCELCGSRKGVECHHVLPMCMEMYGVNFDVEDNYLSVCRKCHALLTPRSLLAKIGNERLRWDGNVPLQIRWRFYDTIGKMLDNGEYVDSDTLFDVFDEVIDGYCVGA